MRLIDADTLLEAIDTKYKRYFNSIGITDYDYEKADEQSRWISDGAAMAAEAVLDLPTIDAVEVVRCKDCKQFRRWIDTNTCFCDITESEISDNDFCSRAERRRG